MALKRAVQELLGQTARRFVQSGSSWRRRLAGEFPVPTGFEQSVIHFIRAYGYVALFVLLALETAMILHFVPSEVIVPVAAATLGSRR
ncbi:MAG: hypothetical protein M3Z31_03110 [Pseudomonadota bacterium]|nr:hypothetical protein [Pseudomonadota bacterium]